MATKKRLTAAADEAAAVLDTDEINRRLNEGLPEGTTARLVSGDPVEMVKAALGDETVELTPAGDEAIEQAEGEDTIEITTEGEQALDKAPAQSEPKPRRVLQVVRPDRDLDAVLLAQRARAKLTVVLASAGCGDWEQAAKSAAAAARSAAHLKNYCAMIADGALPVKYSEQLQLDLDDDPDEPEPDEPEPDEQPAAEPVEREGRYYCQHCRKWLLDGEVAWAFDHSSEAVSDESFPIHVECSDDTIEITAEDAIRFQPAALPEGHIWFCAACDREVEQESDQPGESVHHDGTCLVHGNCGTPVWPRSENPFEEA